MSQKQPLVDPRFLKFQNDIKRTAFGVKFGRALFTGGNGALNEKFLREGFKQLGLEIPPGVELTLDVAQAISAGSALSNAIEVYDGIDDLRSVTNASAATITAAAKVFEAVGWLKADSDEMQMIRTGVNIATLIGSCGMNVQAWVSLALDFTSFESLNAAKAKMIAQKGLVDLVQARINPQATAAAGVFKAYQEKKMSTFAFVGRMAEVAPDLWPQFFPQFESWAPLATHTLTVEAERRTWYGSSSGTQRASYVLESIRGFTPDQIKKFIFTNLAEPVLFPFYIANDAFEKQNKASLMTLAIMSTIGTGFDWIGEGDLSPVLLSNQMTLSDFYEPQVLEYLEQEKDPEALYKSAGIIVSGGQEIRSLREQESELKRKFIYQNREVLEALERSGRADVIGRIPELRQVMAKALTYPNITPKEAFGLWNESKLYEYGRGGDVEKTASLRLAGPGVMWRSPRNFFAALAMIDELRRDEYFAGWTDETIDWGSTSGILSEKRIEGYSSNRRDISTYDFLGTVDMFEGIHAEIQYKSVMRKVNTLAMGNVAFFLDTTPDKLLRVNRNDQSASAVYDKKG